MVTPATVAFTREAAARFGAVGEVREVSEVSEVRFGAAGAARFAGLAGFDGAAPPWEERRRGRSAAGFGTSRVSEAARGFAAGVAALVGFFVEAKEVS
ncbi:MAG: hypothetical protein IPF92_04710 [Myxococcales bacterium]|nr:hypothetical protein [Myxococcales bacterium]